MVQSNNMSLTKVGNKWVLTSAGEHKEFKTKTEARQYYLKLPVSENVELLLDEFDKNILTLLDTFDNDQKQLLLKRYDSTHKILSEVERKVNEYMTKIISSHS